MACKNKTKIAILFGLLVIGFLIYRSPPFFVSKVNAEVATTTVTITICGNSNIEPPEVCDDGVNSGAYSLTIPGRTCLPDCSDFGRYCGDNILQAASGEQCDDGNNISGDRCSDTCQNESTPENSPSGGGGGFNPGSATTLSPTKVIVIGKAYPNADVHVLKDGETVGVVKADSKADFYFSTIDVTPGVATFGFWAEDNIGLRSIAFTTTFRIVPNAVTTVNGAYLPPTITLDKKKLKRGEYLNIHGQSVPNANIFTHINSESEIVQKATTSSGGVWSLPFNTSVLISDDFHTAKAYFETVVSGALAKSGFSQSVSFFVGDREVGTADLCKRSDINIDTRVNLTDFSILLFNWETSEGTADINIDGKVDLKDFSIMLFCWTG